MENRIKNKIVRPHLYYKVIINVKGFNTTCSCTLYPFVMLESQVDIPDANQ